MKAKSLITFASVCLISMQLIPFSTAFAKSGGSMDGGGGDTIVNSKTGEIISIADPIALKSMQGKRISLPKDVTAELKKITSVANTYFFHYHTLNQLTHSENIDYILVDELPQLDICQERITYQPVDETEMKISHTACTAGKKTWIKKSDYDQLLKKDSKRELALLIIHEGLRRVPNLSGEDLVVITNGLRSVMSVYDLQTQGKINPLSSADKESIQNMMGSLLLNGLYADLKVDSSLARRLLDKYEITDFGGLVVKYSTIHPSARIGINSRFDFPITIGADVVIENSTFVTPNDSFIGIDDLAYGKIQDNVKIMNSSLNFYRGAEISSGSSIKNSWLIVKYKLGANLQMNDSSLDVLHTGDNLILNSSHIHGDIDLGSNIQIENSTINFIHQYENVRFGNDIKLKNISWANFSTVDQGLRGKIKGGFKPSGIEFKAGTEIDLENKKLCKSGTSDNFIPFDGMFASIGNKEDLAKICE